MHCAYWKTLGHCKSKKWYMAEYCADTCELCDYTPRRGGRGNRKKGRKGDRRGRRGRRGRDRGRL